MKNPGATIGFWALILVGLSGTLGVLTLLLFGTFEFGKKTSIPRPLSSPFIQEIPPITLASFPKISVWWDKLDPQIRKQTLLSSTESNIHPTDYIGAAACKKCHPANFEGWSKHPHRWMNAMATPQTIMGDFSGRAKISYLGGTARFEFTEGKYLMKLERGNVKRVYEIHQTIGSRAQQYYVGTQIDGPEPKDHPFYTKDHVLPFGFSLSSGEWTPVVHIGPELPDGERPDPFMPPSQGKHFAEYAKSCNFCHTTFAMGDMLGRRPHQMAEHSPLKMHWSIKPYLTAHHPDESTKMEELLRSGEGISNPMASWDAPKFAESLGITCEACHLGSKAHSVSGGRISAEFLPKSPYLSLETNKKIDPGKTHDNINWACGRCHTGTRPTFAGGMSTWNSVEYSDAVKGSCYSKLKCTDCHNPHQATGPKWTQPPVKDDGVCLKCHGEFKDSTKRHAHTHHKGGTEGDRCMNCHMPKIHEGLQDVVRTHMIYSPTRPDMIYANHPNACNICHTDKPIDWTLNYLSKWYDKSYEDWRIALRYPKRDESVAKGWMASDDPAVRLVAANALIRQGKQTDLPLALKALNDPYLINRQFASKSLDEVFQLNLSTIGYKFYQTREEREKSLIKLPILQENTQK